jgi:hypothetical protein
MFNFEVKYIVLIVLMLVIASAGYTYMHVVNERTNHKMKAMLNVVSVLTEEVNHLTHHINSHEPDVPDVPTVEKESKHYVDVRRLLVSDDEDDDDDEEDDEEDEDEDDEEDEDEDEDEDDEDKLSLEKPELGSEIDELEIDELELTSEEPMKKWMEEKVDEHVEHVEKEEKNVEKEENESSFKMEDIHKLTIPALRQFAQDKGLAFSTKMKKPELLILIKSSLDK